MTKDNGYPNLRPNNSYIHVFQWWQVHGQQPGGQGMALGQIFDQNQIELWGKLAEPFMLFSVKARIFFAGK